MSNVPKLRFKEFSEENRVQKLKEVVLSNTYGPRFNANDYDDNGNVKTIRGTDVSLDGSIKYNQVPTAQLDEKFIKSHILEDGDLVMITTADCGLTGIFEEQNEKYICSAYAVKITLNKSLTYPYYFKYYFQTTLAKNEVNKYIRKATVANLPASDILRFSHRLPSKQEQEKIASFLTSVDTKIEQLTKKEQLLSSYKKGVMQKIFSGEIRFKADDGSEFCEWEETKIEEMFKFKQGVQCGVENQYFEQKKGQIRFIRIVDVTQNDEPIRYIDDPGKEHHIFKDDLFMVRYGAAGVIGYGYEGVIANNLFRFLPVEVAKTYNKYYYFLFNFMKQKFEQLAGSSTMPALNFKSLNTLTISQPKIEEQIKIANFLSSIDFKEEQVQKQLASTKAFKKALLQQMFV